MITAHYLRNRLSKIFKTKTKNHLVDQSEKKAKLFKLQRKSKKFKKHLIKINK
jgi:hypothetical protein